MKSKNIELYFGIFIIVSLCMASTAGAENLGSYQLSNAASLVGFTAPSFADRTNATLVGGSSVGDIIFETNSSAYWGRINAGTSPYWVQLSPAAGSNNVISEGADRIERVQFTCSPSSCTVVAGSASGPWLNGAPAYAAGSYTVNINSGIFTGNPVCTCSSNESGVGNTMCFPGTVNTTQVIVSTQYPLGTPIDSQVTLICQGLH